jgi:hypothetical protein
MACPRCGCHLVSRASGARGGLRNVLVCTGCNQPIETRLQAGGWRRRIAEAGTLLALLFAGGVLFTLSTLHDLRSPSQEPAAGEPGRGEG